MTEKTPTNSDQDGPRASHELPSEVETYDEIEIGAETIPDEMKGYDQWINWSYIDGRKSPEAMWRSGADDRFKWSKDVNRASFEMAQKWVDPVIGNGLGFIITEDDPFVLIDFDDAVVDGQVDEEVWEIIEKVETYADVSTSETGFHLMGKAELPDGVTTIQEEVSEQADIEVYDSGRFCAVTGDHIAGTPKDTLDIQDDIEWIVDEYGPSEEERKRRATAGGIDPADREPERTREEVQDVETAEDIEVIYDAIQHTDIHDVRLRSDVTEERADGVLSLDPSWAQSDSGTRLGYDDGGFIYRAGDIGLDILQVVALEERIIHDEREYPSGEDFWKAVEALRSRGAHIPELDEPEDSGTVFEAMPIERILQMGHADRRRFAKEQDVEWPTVHEVRKRLGDQIDSLMADEKHGVVASPTGSGKTYFGSTEPWEGKQEVTGGQPVVHAHATRPARDQAVEESEEAGVTYKVLKGRGELCPLAKGEWDEKLTIEGMKPSEWFEFRCDGQGIPLSVAHRWAEHEIGETVCAEEGQCPSTTQFENIPRDDNGIPTCDVIHCTHQFLMVPSLRLQTNVLIDEKPAYGLDIEPEDVRKSVNAYLDYSPVPFSNYHELVQAAREGTIKTDQTAVVDGEMKHMYKSATADEVVEEIVSEAGVYDILPALDVQTLANYVVGKDEAPDAEDIGVDQITEMLDEATDYQITRAVNGEDLISAALDTQPPLDWYKNHHDAHSLAPAFARAIWNAEESAGDLLHARVPYKPPRFESDAHDSEGWNRVYVDVILDEDYEIRSAESVPDFSLTRSVVGLDAHPADDDPWWQVDTIPGIQTHRILDREERTLYRRYERGLFTVQVGDSTQPVASGKYIEQGQGRRMDALVGHIADHHDDFSTAITSSAAKAKLETVMENHGVESPETMHYGNEESRNDFAGEEAGLVFGSHDFGDGPIMEVAARLGLDVDVEKNDCPECGGIGGVDGQVCAQCKGEGVVRALGRGFSGKDAERADDILHGWREHHTAQSAGRWARNADDPTDAAVVYVVTDAVPDGFIDVEAPGCEWLPTEDQAERFEWFRDQEEAVTAREYAEATGVSKQTALRDIQTYRERGLAECVTESGPYGAHVFASSGEGDFLADVDLAELGSTVTERVVDTYTWSVAVEATVDAEAAEGDEDRGPKAHQTSIDLWASGLEPPS